MEEQSVDKRVVEAEEFVLKGKDGRTLAILGADSFDNPTFQLFDRKGAKRCEVTLAPDGTPFIFLLNDQNNPQITIAGEPGSTLIALKGINGHTQIHISADKAGGACVGVRNIHGETAIAMAVDERGFPSF